MSYTPSPPTHATPLAHASPTDPTDIVGRRVLAFLFDFLIVGVLSLIIGATGFVNAFSSETELFDSAGAATKHCDEVNVDTSDLLDGDPVCIAVEDEAIEVSYDSDAGNLAVLPIAHGALWLLQILLQAFTGATIGKFMTGIRVVRESGERPGLWRSAVRTVAYFIDGFPWFPPMILGLIATVTSKRHRRLGDRFAGTFVVKKSAAGYPLPDAHLHDVRLQPEASTATQPARRDPVTGKLPPPAMPGSNPTGATMAGPPKADGAPGNEAMSAGAAAAARHRASMPERPVADLAPPTPSPTGEFAVGQNNQPTLQPPTQVQDASAAGAIAPEATALEPVENSLIAPQPAIHQQPVIQQPALGEPTAQLPAVQPPSYAEQPVPQAQQPQVHQPGMPDGVVWDATRNAYIFSDGTRLMQWNAEANTWVKL